MRKLTKTLLTTLQLQLFLNIISLIIISHWGLPLSSVAPLSNIIFSPILTIFLLLSSLIFFLELLYIPNEWLIYLLELTTHAWSNIMALANRSFIINVSKPSTLFTVCALAITGAILQSTHLKEPIRRMGAFALLLAGILLYLGYTQVPQQDIQTIPVGKKNVTVIHTHGVITIIDHGGLTQAACNKGWIEFTLLPLLRQTYATDTITHLIALRPMVKALQNINELSQITSIKNVYLPYWQGVTPRNLGRAYCAARENLEKHGKLHRISNKALHLRLDTTSSLKIQPQTKQNSYQTITFPDMHLECILAKKAVILNHAPAM